MGILTKEQKRAIIESYSLKEGKEVHSALKDIFGEVIQEMLEAELDGHLGYEKHDYKNKQTSNSRNGSKKKKLKSSLGELEIKTPQDRNSDFEPVAVKKYQTDISGIEDKIMNMYATNSTRDISKHLNELYGIDVSADTISRISDRIIPKIKEWQNRPLREIYPILYLDGFNCNVKSNGNYSQKTSHIVMGINLDGNKEILGIWLAENESSKFWLTVLNELRNRGLKDVLIACVDGLNGFTEAIKSVYPKTEIQKCVVHQIRTSTKFVNYKDLKPFCADMKEIYKAPNEESGLQALEEFSKKWDSKYAYAIKSWYTNWDNLSTFFKYPEEIRKLIYTTNPIENFNRVLRKHTKRKVNFPNDDSLLKVLYLVSTEMEKKWVNRCRDWNMIINQLAVYFEERLANYI